MNGRNYIAGMVTGLLAGFLPFNCGATITLRWNIPVNCGSSWTIVQVSFPSGVIQNIGSLGTGEVGISDGYAGATFQAQAPGSPGAPTTTQVVLSAGQTYGFNCLCDGSGTVTTVPTNQVQVCTGTVIHNVNGTSCEYCFETGTPSEASCIDVPAGEAGVLEICLPVPKAVTLTSSCTGIIAQFGTNDVPWLSTGPGGPTGGQVSDSGGSGTSNPRTNPPVQYSVTNTAASDSVLQSGFNALHNDILNLTAGGARANASLDGILRVLGTNTFGNGTNGGLSLTNYNLETTQVGVSNMLHNLTNHFAGGDRAATNYTDQVTASNAVKAALGPMLATNSAYQAQLGTSGDGLAYENAHDLLQLSFPAMGCVATNAIMDLDPETNPIMGPIVHKLRELFGWLLSLGFIFAVWKAVENKMENTVLVPQKVATSIVGMAPGVNLAVGITLAATAATAIGVMVILGGQYLASESLSVGDSLSGAIVTSVVDSPDWWKICIHYLYSIFPVEQFFIQMGAYWIFFFVLQAVWMGIVGFMWALTA